MKVIILAGGLGTRLSEYTEEIPKPMVTIGGLPILTHIMNRYAKYGHKDFYLALGYKSHLIKDFFLNYSTLNSDFTVDLSSGAIQSHKNHDLDWTVTLVDTGLSTMTGGRAKQMQRYIGNQTCMLTYGDGVSDVDINQLIKFHKSHGKLATLTAVRPSARFGELSINDSTVIEFQEKPQLQEGWINGGYFVFEPEFFDLIHNDSDMLERSPLENAARMGQLMAYKHNGFWKCMDTKRDRELLESLWSHNAPWV